MVRPTHLPHVRDRMITLLSDRESPFRRALRGDAALKFDAAAGHLAAAGLYWVTQDMAALAAAAAARLDTVRWASADRAVPMGLMVMDGGVGQFRHDGLDYPIDAMTWGPIEGDRLLLTMWIARRRLDDRAAGQGFAINADFVPPLVPVSVVTEPVSMDERPVEDIDPVYRTLATTIYAAWHLMEQPTISERRPVEVDRRRQRAYIRNGRPEPRVSIVDLRTLYRPQPTEQEEPDDQAGRYSHRWVVTGHWRNQAHGPDRALRKRIWVPDYIKGPDGAPLLGRERVNVWRR